MLLAAQSMAIGTILVRYVCKYADPIMATGYHMLLGGIPLMLLSLQQESSLLSERLPLITGNGPLKFLVTSLLDLGLRKSATYSVPMQSRYLMPKLNELR